jgi:hypothetical protein
MIGKDTVVGALLAWSKHEVVIRVEEPHAGLVNLHFPRVGFDVHPDTLRHDRTSSSGNPSFDVLDSFRVHSLHGASIDLRSDCTQPRRVRHTINEPRPSDPS